MKKILILICALAITPAKAQSPSIIGTTLGVAPQAPRESGSNHRNLVIGCVAAAVIGAVVGINIYASQNNPGQIRLATF